VTFASWPIKFSPASYRTHGGEADITLVVDASNVTSASADLCITIVNTAGPGHMRSMELQAQHGFNFLLNNNSIVDLVGNADSSFLGMREISAAANVLNADISILFEELVVRTTFKFTALVVEEPEPVEPMHEEVMVTHPVAVGDLVVAEPVVVEAVVPVVDTLMGVEPVAGELAAVDPVVMEPAVEALVMEPALEPMLEAVAELALEPAEHTAPCQVMFIICDDDQAPRMMASALLKRPELNANEDSVVLGETFLEATSIPELVQQESNARGPMNVVCMFDQNMHYDEGSVYGSELVMKLRAIGFNGLVIMRSANDSEDSQGEYLAAGADVVLSKGMGVRVLISRIPEMLQEAIQNPDRHSHLHAANINP